MESPLIVAQPPPQVSRIMRLLCEPWMSFLRFRGRRRMRRTVMENVCGGHLIVLKGVFNPVIFRTGKYLADFILQTPLLDEKRSGVPTALDMGCGSGILAVVAALRGYCVTAVDIDERAVECTRFNAAIQDVLGKVKAVQGDLFEPIEGETYDLVVFSLPKARDWPDVERFAAGLSITLKPTGLALFVLTSHCDGRRMLTALSANGLSTERLTWRHFGADTKAIYSAQKRK